MTRAFDQARKLAQLIKIFDQLGAALLRGSSGAFWFSGEVSFLRVGVK